METSNRADFCIEIDFQRESEAPARVFRTMTALIDSFERIDKRLLQSIEAKLEPVLILEDVESGSIKTWLKTIIKEIDDDALKNIDRKPQIGKYLVKGKYILVNFLEDKTQITDRREVAQVTEHLLEAARETDVLRIPSYNPLSPKEVAASVQEITEAVSFLKEGDKAKYVTVEGKTSFNITFRFSPEAVEQLLTRESLRHSEVMILKVKKPDYLGESMWEFRHAGRSILAKIQDCAWLERFQRRTEDVRPGDALRAKVDVTVNYGYDGEVLDTHYDVISVLEVIRIQPSEQGRLFDGDGSDSDGNSVH